MIFLTNLKWLRGFMEKPKRTRTAEQLGLAYEILRKVNFFWNLGKELKEEMILRLIKETELECF